MGLEETVIIMGEVGMVNIRATITKAIVKKRPPVGTITQNILEVWEYMETITMENRLWTNTSQINKKALPLPNKPISRT